MPQKLYKYFMNREGIYKKILNIAIKIIYTKKSHELNFNFQTKINNFSSNL